MVTQNSNYYMSNVIVCNNKDTLYTSSLIVLVLLTTGIFGNTPTREAMYLSETMSLLWYTLNHCANITLAVYASKLYTSYFSFGKFPSEILWVTP